LNHIKKPPHPGNLPLAQAAPPLYLRKSSTFPAGGPEERGSAAARI